MVAELKTVCDRHGRYFSDLEFFTAGFAQIGEVANRLDRVEAPGFECVNCK